MVREFAKRREQFIRDLNRVPGFRCSPPEGAFYAWVNIVRDGNECGGTVPHHARRGWCRCYPRRGIRGRWRLISSVFRLRRQPLLCRRQSIGFCECLRRLAKHRCGSDARISGTRIEESDKREIHETNSSAWLIVPRFVRLSLLAVAQARPLPGPDVRANLPAPASSDRKDPYL